MRAADRTALKAIVLQQSDLPTGWTGAAYQPDPTDAKNKAQFAQCTGHRNTESDKVSEVHSDDYIPGRTALLAGDQLLLGRRGGRGQGRDAELEGDQLLRAVGEARDPGRLPSGMKVERLSVQISKPSVGDPSNVIAWGDATVVVSQDGQQTTVYTAAAFIVGPLVEAEIDFTNVGSPIPASVRQQLATIVAERAAHP